MKNSKTTKDDDKSPIVDTLSDVTLPTIMNRGDILVSDGGNSIISMPHADHSLQDDIKEMKMFKDFIFSSGIISKEEYDRYKEDIKLLKSIN